MSLLRLLNMKYGFTSLFFKITAIIFTLTSVHYTSFGQLPWTEDFSSYPTGLGYDGCSGSVAPSGGFPTGVTAFTIDASAGALTTCTDYINVSASGALQIRDVDGDVSLTTQLIDISGCSPVGFSVDITEIGDLESFDHADVYYSIDGGTFNQIVNWNGNGSSTHTLVGDLLGGVYNDADWGTETVSFSGFTGNTLQIKIVVRNDAGGETITIDNISVTGACGGPFCGDGTCDAGETSATCPVDCGSVCGDGVCNGTETNATCPGDCPPTPVSIIINEISQGTAQQEYVEFMVTGPIICDPDTASCLDLRGWVFDDNNGFLNGGAPASGVGIAAGASRFLNDPFWACVPAGTRILIYNDGDPNPDIAPIDTDLHDGNCSIILPISSTLFEQSINMPNASNINYSTSPADWAPGGGWTPISMANGSDGFQIYNPANLTNPVFSVGWGTNGTHTNNQGDVFMGTGSAAGDVFSFNNTNNDDPFDQSNWGESPVATGQSPGVENNNDNYDWMVSMNSSCRIPLAIALTPLAAVCGNCSGSATSTVTGDVTPYTYSWSNTSTITSISALCPGTYDLTITDAIGCTITETTTITDTPIPTVTAAVAQNETCAGLCDGQATGTITGGVTPFSYLWNNGSTSATATGLCPNSYTVTITDGNNCSNFATITITPGTTITAAIAPLLNQCLTGNNFSFNGTASTISSSSITSYLWEFGDGNTGTGATTLHSYAAAGTYTITLTVSNGSCQNSTTTSVTVNPMPIINLLPTNITCNGINNGQIIATGSAGLPPFSYLWSGPAGFTPATPNAGATDTETGLVPGIYTVTISDGNNCAVTITTPLNEPPSLTLTTSGTSPSCPNGSNGTALTTTLGGTPPYTYQWDNISFSTTSSLSGLTANTYNITASDALGCTITNNLLIIDPPNITLTTSSSSSTCGNSDGSVSVVATGGAGGYIYNWNTTPPQTTSTALNLYAGSFAVTVTDASSCSITTNSNIIDAGGPTLSVINIINATCNGFSDGAAETSVSGGTPSYTYLWSNGAITPITSSLPAGIHSVTITDSNTPTGCVTSTSFTITDSPPLNAAILSSTNPLCYGGSDGNASVSVNGGVTNYSYLWSNGSTTNPANGFTAGNVIVTITDSQNCTTTTSTSLTEPTPIIVSLTSTDVLCNGGSNGSVISIINGGTTGYSFLWSNGLTTQNISGVPTGSFTSNITDANGCTASTTTIVNQPTPLTVSLNCFNVTYPGGSDGTSIATSFGGTSSYTYVWNISSSTTNNITGLSAGTINVTSTDINGCVATTSCIITAPNCSVTGSASATATLCLGSSNGTTTATMNTGSTSPYFYLWDTNASSQTTQTATGLIFGPYSATITDTYGCSTTVTTNVISPAAMIVTLTPTNLLCIGGNSGSATATVVSGGTPSYSYLWSNASTQQTATGLTVGNYTITITDFNNCIGTGAITLTEPTAISSSIIGNNVSCFGANDGNASISVIGGTSPYNYIWDDPSFQTTSIVSGIGNDTLHVTVTDANGCLAIDSIKITEPINITATTNFTASTCGQSDGSAAITSVGSGFSPYSYLWNTGQTTIIATGLYAGSYTVTITDGNACVIVESINVSDASGPVPIATTNTNVVCNGGSNGSVSVSSSGGSTPYTFLWSGGNGTTTSISGLTSGNYTVTVTDATGCAATAITSVSEPPLLLSSINSINPSCFSYSDGSASVTAIGGTAPYSYAWSNGSTSNSLSGIGIGNIIITVTDNVGCITSNNTILTQPSALVISLTPNNTSCFGALDGTISTFISGGTTNYTYLWSNASNTKDLTAVGAGNYTITITDANNCTTSAISTISEPTAITATITTFTNVSCFGFNDGNASVNAFGGTSPFSYLWSPSNQTNPTENNLVAGNYSVIVSDANNCSVTVPVTITQPPSLSLTLSPTNPSCFGINDGIITSVANGGNSPYNYIWSTTATSTNITNIGGGTYNLTLTDTNNCSITSATTLIEPTELILNSSSNQSTCGNSDGDVTVFVTQGDPAYTFLWNDLNNQNSAMATGLYAGNYTVTVTDGNNCSSQITQGVTDAGAPTASIISQTNVSCFGYSDGLAQVAVIGGSMPYSYSWNDPSSQNTASVTGLPAGTWSTVITDALGCIAATGVVITEPTAISAVISTHTDVTCYGFTDGSATALGNGGTSPYFYVWNNGQTTATATGLPPISYIVAVSDANNCPTNISVTIAEPLAITLSTNATDAFCNTATGQVCVSTTNGIAPLSYLWSNGQTNSCAAALIPNGYSVSVTDINGCVASTTDIVGNIAPGIASISGVSNVSCFNGNDGYASVSMSGFSTPFTYLWDASTGFQNTTTATGLNTGTYNVSVTDINNCMVSTAVTITAPQPITVTTAITDASCYNLCDGEIFAMVSGGTSPYNYQWNDPLTQASQIASGLCVGTFIATITDNNNCSTTISENIAEPSPLQIDSTVVNANCGQNDGSGCISVSGGTPGYSFTWQNGTLGPCVNTVSAGAYIVLVSDANGCDVNHTVIVSDNAAPSVSVVSITDATCFGYSDGSAQITASGGASGYTYEWNDLTGTIISNTPFVTNLTANLYTITVTDGTGCKATTSISVSQPSSLQTNISSTNPLCFGYTNGSAAVTVIGGTSGYTYSWNTSPPHTIASVTELIPSKYTVNITDFNGCTIRDSVLITEPNPLTVIITTTDASCFGFSDGLATAIPSSGVGNYYYLWSNNQTATTANNLGFGNYFVTITDDNNCQTIGFTTIREPSVLVAQITNFGNNNCFGDADGHIQLTAFGGTPPIASYNWTSSVSSSTLATALPAGIYNTTITDSNGCSITTSQEITQPTQVNAVILNANDISCFGACDGSATASASGGISPYFYQWNLAGSLQQTPTAQNLCASNSIIVTATDNKGCSSTASVSITEPAELFVSITPSSPHCGLNDGQIQLNLGGGTPPYTYSWNDILLPNSPSIDSLSSGAYTVTVLDANGCNYIQATGLNDISGPIISYVSHTDVSCFGICDGAANASVNGGTTPYQNFNWISQNGDTILSGSLGVTNLCGNENYTLVVSDFAGCTATFIQHINSPSEVISAITTYTNVSCFGGNNGTATVQAGGGTGYSSDFTYVWVPSNQNTTTATGLSAGIYSITSSDANGCSSVSPVTISEPTPLVPSTTSTNSTCFDGNNGSITVNTTGGTGFLIYNWNPNSFANPNSFSNSLTAGNYSLTVTDQNGCTAVTSTLITEPSPIIASISTTDSYCSLANGTASIYNVSGGTSGYSYHWQNSFNTNTQHSYLIEGVYFATITDAYGCTLNINTTVTNQAGPIITDVILTPPLCNGNCNGSAEVKTIGGTAPISYLWNDNTNQTASTASNLCARNYCISVSDANGCIAISCNDLIEPAAINIIAATDNPTPCAGQETSIWATPFGGTTPYDTIIWSANGTGLIGYGSHAINMLAGSNETYIATIFDSNGCSNSDTVNLASGTELLLNTPDTVEICLGDQTTICSSGSGGLGSTAYQWSWVDSSICTGVNTCCYTVNPTDTTDYLITLKDGCTTPVSNILTVIVNPLPTPAFGALNTEGCPPYTVYFNGNSSMENSNVLWDFNGDGITDLTETNVVSGAMSSPEYTYQNAGFYDVGITVESPAGCKSSVVFPNYIHVYPGPIASFITTPSSTTNLTPFVEVDASFTIGADSLLIWDFNDPFSVDTAYGVTLTHLYQDTGHYYIALDAVNVFGCHDYDTSLFVIAPDFAIYAPNAITPNGDGINDGFRLKGIGFDQYELYIFDRWGEQIFYTDDKTKEWMGDVKFNEVTAPNDTYIWKAYITPTGWTTPKTYMGHVSIIR